MSDNKQYWLDRVSRSGRRPSAGASKEEKDAYEAYIRMPLIESGELSPEDLPEAYGGRPTGTSRRAIRMQAEYDARQQNFLQNQRIAQQMEIEQGVYNLRLDQEDRLLEAEKISFEAAQLAEAREAKVQDEASLIFRAIRGGVPTSDGEFTPPINPEDENAVLMISNLMGLQYGMENPVAKEAIMGLYRDALRAQQKREVDMAAKVESDAQKITELTKLATATNRNPDDLFVTDPDTEELIINPVAVGEAQAELDMVTETRRAEAAIQATENRDRIAREKELDRDIRRENQRLIELRSQRESTAQKQAIEASRNKILDLRVEKAELQGLVFDSEEEAEKELSQQDQVALNWANANPDDPRAKRIKDKLGVQ
jgi:hypothetical protein